MIGTLINITAILVGGVFGLIFGAQLSERVRETVVAGLGLFTGAIGIQMFLKVENPIIVLGALLIGGILGEWWKIETRLRNIGEALERKFSKDDFNPANGQRQQSLVSQSGGDGNRFIRGFLTASLVFCVGPMTILGSIQDGLYGDYQLLAIKSVLDGSASLAFASSLGIGVLFSILVVLTFQGGISLLAAQAQAVLSTSMMNEMTAVGGLLLIGLAISSLFEIKPIRTGNFLPALVIAPLIVAIVSALVYG
jgi:uncharacterized membrane protein YqgA involved in biofilm formation